MFGGNKIKLDKDLMARLQTASKAAGYSSVDEFVVHILTRELDKVGDGGTEEEIKKRLEGLGYIS